jgi:hypothetical protein
MDSLVQFSYSEKEAQKIATGDSGWIVCYNISPDIALASQAKNVSILSSHFERGKRRGTTAPHVIMLQGAAIFNVLDLAAISSMTCSERNQCIGAG